LVASRDAQIGQGAAQVRAQQPGEFELNLADSIGPDRD
jgi:hypothetical protein